MSDIHTQPERPIEEAQHTPDSRRHDADIQENGASKAVAVADGDSPQAHDGWHRLGPLLAVIGAGVALSISTGSFAVVAFMLGIVAIVMLHEAGHFVVAKACGMKVTEFFFGFGPRLWSMRRGETSYGIKALPLGGYVKIVGMSSAEKGVDPVEEPRTYRQQSYPKRVAVAIAGVVTQFIVAFLLLVVLWTVLGVPNYDKPTLTIGSISAIDGGASPAVEAGLEVGDKVVSVGGRKLSSWDDLPAITRSSPERPLAFEVLRDGKPLTLTAVPAAIERDGETVGFVGIGSKPTVDTVGPIDGVTNAASDLWNISIASVKGIGTFFNPAALSDYASDLKGEVTGGGEQVPDEKRMVSVVGLVHIAGQAAESGIFNLVNLLVIFNIFVGLINLVPLLPFDGGHIAIATYERIRSRAGQRYHADANKMTPVVAAVLLLFVVLGIASLYLDITRPISNPFQ